VSAPVANAPAAAAKKEEKPKEEEDPLKEIEGKAKSEFVLNL
jgi:hypothetical protein